MKKDPALSVLSLRIVWLFQYLSMLYSVIRILSRQFLILYENFLVSGVSFPAAFIAGRSWSHLLHACNLCVGRFWVLVRRDDGSISWQEPVRRR
jgi:hypothetical protein